MALIAIIFTRYPIRRIFTDYYGGSDESVCAIFQPTEEQLALFIEIFGGQLLEYIRNSLVKAVLTAWNSIWLPELLSFQRSKPIYGMEIISN